jgi:hypothetical protein
VILFCSVTSAFLPNRKGTHTMKLLTLTTALALTATTAMSEGYKPEPKPPVVEEPTRSSGGDDLLPILLGVILVGIIASQRQAPDLTERRPLVEPDMCMDKLGVWGECDG